MIVEELQEVVCEKKKVKKNDGFKPIKHRGRLEYFVEAIGKMNQMQKETVEEYGFGRLLRMEAFPLPSFMCRWLVQSYNAMKGKILLPDGSAIDVTDIDVEICMGIPRGPVHIIKFEPMLKMDVVEKWRKNFDKKLHSIRYNHVGEHMLSIEEGGEEFIRNFIVLFHSCVVEPTQRGAANQSLIRGLEQLNSLSTMNWCGFVIDCLIEAKKRWDTNPDGYFTGPLYFLTVLYLDRVILYGKRTVPRKFPTFVGWNEDLVAAREEAEMSWGVFGDGNLEPQLSIKKRQGVACAVQGSSTKKEYNKGMLKDLKLIANAIISIADRTKNMPVECKDDAVSIALTESARALLGSRSDSLHEAPFDVCTQVENVLSQAEDPFWTSPELTKVVEEIEAALSRRNDIMKCENDKFGFDEGIPFCQADSGHADMPQGNAGTSEVDPLVEQHQSETPAVVDDPSKTTEATTVENVDPPAQIHEVQPNPSDVVMGVVNDIAVEHHQTEPVAPAQPTVAASDVKEIRTKKSTCGRPGKGPAIPQTDSAQMDDNEEGDDFVTPMRAVQQNTKRNIKLPATKKSPWLNRIINASKTISKQQQDLYSYVMNHAPDGEPLFDYNGYTLDVSEFQTLKESTYVSINIVDLWCVYLNDLEEARNHTSASRLFVHPSTTVGPLSIPNKVEYDSKFSIFKDGLDELVASIDHTSLVDVDLSRMFFQYMDSLNLGSRCSGFTRGRMFVLKMMWRDNKNKVDCGIYLMRHMETYFGQALNNWQTGFKPNSKKCILPLRHMYLHALITQKKNILKDCIIEDATAHMRV